MQNQHRQLAAILFTDIVGYTAMMQQNEAHAVATVKHYISVLQKTVLEHEGKVLNDYGDGSLCSFASATQAVKCALAMQQQLQIDPSVPLRIGLHVGEIFFEEGKVLGDGVNVASRIQSLGQANTILFSREICDKIRNQPEFKSISLGMFEFKNVEEPIEVFALSNEGLIVPRRENMEGKLKEVKKKSARKKLALVLVAFLLLLAGFVVYRNFFRVLGFSGDDKTIAVLPFDNIGLPDSDEYISDGIAEEVINNLSKISSLEKVISWYSAKTFKGTKKTINQIASELDVSAVLTATIEKQGNTIHIIAELTDVNSRKRLWGEALDYDIKEIPTIQTKIAERIVNALQASLTPEEKKELSKQNTENPEAYNLCLKGRFFWNKGGPAAFDSAEHYYTLAIQADPSYALAFSGLADCYRLNYRLNPAEAIPIAKSYALKALSLDSTLCEAWTTIGFIQSIIDHNWTEAKLTLKKAIGFNPNYPLAKLYYGQVFLFTGSTDEGLKWVEKAAELDPLSILVGWPLGRNYYESRHYDLAIKQLQKILILDSNFELAKPWIGLSYVQQHRYKEANEIFNQIQKDSTEKAFLLSYSYSMSGDLEKAVIELKKGIEIQKGSTLYFGNGQSHFFAAQAYLGIGNVNDALSELESSFEAHEYHLDNIKIDPAFDAIHNEPRFKELLKKMNLE